MRKAFYSQLRVSRISKAWVGALREISCRAHKIVKLLAQLPINSPWKVRKNKGIGPMFKQVQIMQMKENKSLGIQYFEIHEMDPAYKIDRIVYREKSRSGWFKELTPELFEEKTQNLQ